VLLVEGCSCGLSVLRGPAGHQRHETDVGRMVT